MKKLVYSAIALSVASAGAIASDNDWSTLDQDIEQLTASTLLDTTGPKISGRVRTYYQSSGDLTAGGGNDLGDFNVAEARFKLTGTRGDYGYTVQVDFAGGFSLKDAYLDFPLGGQVNGRFGQFKAGFARSALISAGNLFFIDRSQIGGAWSSRREGFMLSGEFDQLGWWLTLQDGGDTSGDEWLITGKVDFDLLGEGAGNVEGAYGGTEEPSATAAIAFSDDGATDDNDSTLIEFHGGTNVYSFGIDFLTIGDALATTNGSATHGTFGTMLEADSSPMSISGTYMLQPDTWELGVRYQDLDNTADENRFDVGVINHLDGHKLKWTLQYSSTSSDITANEIDWIALQLQLAF